MSSEPSAPGPPRRHPGWRHLLTALVVLVAVALVGFAVWATTLVRSVDDLRGRVEQRVGWLQGLSRLEREAQTGEGMAAEAELGRLLEEIASAKGAGPELRKLARDTQAASAPGEVSAALVPAIRRETGALSAELGERWDAIYRLVAVSLVLALSTLASLVYIRAVVLRRTEARLVALEDHLGDADRLATIGTLAAGVAHEINNPLTYIVSNLELLALDPDDPERETLIAEAREGTERVRRIVLDLREVARPGSSELAPCTPAEALDAAANIAAAELREVAKIERVYLPSPAALASSDRLVQVCLNLILNAADAMRGRAGAEHRLTLRVAPHGEDRVILEVEDTGGGIDPQILDRIFEPFATTKAVGRGTGLGLFVTRNLVHSMGGTIALLPGSSGVRARIELPVAPGDDAPQG